MERYLAQPTHGGGSWRGALVLPQLDDGTDLIDFLGEALPSPWNRWEEGGMEEVGGMEGGVAGIGM